MTGDAIDQRNEHASSSAGDRRARPSADWEPKERGGGHGAPVGGRDCGPPRAGAGRRPGPRPWRVLPRCAGRARRRWRSRGREASRRSPAPPPRGARPGAAPGIAAHRQERSAADRPVSRPCSPSSPAPWFEPPRRSRPGRLSSSPGGEAARRSGAGSGDRLEPAHVQEGLLHRESLDQWRGLLEEGEQRLARLRVGGEPSWTTAASGQSRRANRPPIPP